MKKINIVDMTLRQSTGFTGLTMSFKEKLEVAKQMDHLNVDVIEMPKISDSKSDILLIRSIASLLKKCIVSCTVGLSKEEINKGWEAVKEARHPRLHVIIPTSTVSMEYELNKKPEQIISLIEETVSYCSSLCNDVEFSAYDATRSEKEFLAKAIKSAINSGATTISLCDNAGIRVPAEINGFMNELYNDVPELRNVSISAECWDDLKMATANSFAAALSGANGIKTNILGLGTPSLESMVNTINRRGDSYNLKCDVNHTSLVRTFSRFSELPIDIKTEIENAPEFKLSENTTVAELSKSVKILGYKFSKDELAKVYEEFINVAHKKEIGTKELEVIIATSAIQVPQTYILSDYVINSGKNIDPTAQITLEKDGKILKGLSTGDGPIAAAFLAIEQMVGSHYELDDFQIHSVTEGSEAMGTAIVKLRYQGKIYSGTGISTDIIGSSIRAYISALNKIVYKEV